MYNTDSDKNSITKNDLIIYSNLEERKFANAEEMIKKGENPRTIVAKLTYDNMLSIKDLPSGMKWNKMEKEFYESLPSKYYQKKYLIDTMGFESTILANVTTSTSFSTKTQNYEMADKYFQEAKSILKQVDSILMLPQEKQDYVISLLIKAYQENHYDATEILILQMLRYSGKYSDDYDATTIIFDLCDKGGILGYYYYYLIYMYNLENGGGGRFTREKAIKYLNIGVNAGHPDCLDAAARLIDRGKGPIAGDLFLTAGLVSKDPYHFFKASEAFAENMEPLTAYPVLSTACLRMAIMLGGSYDSLILRYKVGYMMVADQEKAKALQLEQANGIPYLNGLNPYFDERFPPEKIIDLSPAYSLINYTFNREGARDGLFTAIKKGSIPDPRKPNMTQFDEEMFYMKLNQHFIGEINNMKFYIFDMFDYLKKKKNLNGFPSARPFVFNKELIKKHIDLTQVIPETDWGYLAEREHKEK